MNYIKTHLFLVCMLGSTASGMQQAYNTQKLDLTHECPFISGVIIGAAMGGKLKTNFCHNNTPSTKPIPALKDINLTASKDSTEEQDDDSIINLMASKDSKSLVQSIFDDFTTEEQAIIIAEMANQRIDTESDLCDAKKISSLLTTKRWTAHESRAAAARLIANTNVYTEYIGGCCFYRGIFGASIKRGIREEADSRYSMGQWGDWKLRLDLNQRQYTVSDEQVTSCKEIIVKNYKIHCMPSYTGIDDEKYITEIFKRIVTAINTDPAFSELIYTFKITKQQLPDSELLSREKNGEKIFPRIIIYPASGKENAEKLLNKLVIILNDIPGSGITPRYNQKVTNLLFYAQGDGDFETNEHVNDYQERFGVSPYEEPARIHFARDFTGTEQDYHLTWK